jgi:aerobic C4-dicarboxylate transport protein
MSEVRALTNIIGNGVAALVVARWTGDLNVETTMDRRLRAGPLVELNVTAEVSADR